MQIKTLDEILADMGKPVSADFSHQNNTGSPSADYNDKSTTRQTPVKKPTLPNTKSAKHHTKHLTNNVQSNLSDDGNSTAQLADPTPTNPTHTHKKTKTHQSKTHANTATSNVQKLLYNQEQTILDDKTLQLLSQVEIEALELPDRDTRYLRWLAFYYLSKRELSRHELRTKLIAKDCDPIAIDELLNEFNEKGYQSDERCATMMVREAVRKGRGIRHITESLKKAWLDVRAFGGLDELIALADVASVSDGTVLDTDEESDEINWLKLAVEARSKKYGNHVPTDPKEKARQLRFLQYRGFEMSVCFDALKMTLDDF